MYNDGTSLNVVLSDTQLKGLHKNIAEDFPAVLLPEIGILVLKDIRSVIYVPPMPEENPSFDPELTDEQKEYIRIMQMAEAALTDDPADDHDEDADYKGGMIG